MFSVPLASETSAVKTLPLKVSPVILTVAGSFTGATVTTSVAGDKTLSSKPSLSV